MQNNFITNLIDLKGIKVTKFRNREHRVRIHIELPVREHTCPFCHSKTTKIHDYRYQLIKDIPFTTTRIVIYIIENVDILVLIVINIFMKKILSYLSSLEKLID